MKRLVLLAVIGLFVFFPTQSVSGQVMQKKVVAELDARYLEYEGVLTVSSDVRASAATR